MKSYSNEIPNVSTEDVNITKDESIKTRQLAESLKTFSKSITTLLIINIIATAVIGLKVFGII